MVKSRRCASRFQSRPNFTVAWRPKVSTSSRRVVTSNGWPSDHHRDGAVLDTGRHRLEARALGAAPSPRRAAPSSRCRCRRAASRAARCAPRRRPRAPPRRRARARKARSRADARISQGIELHFSIPGRACRSRCAPERRSSSAASPVHCASTMKLPTISTSAAMVSHISVRERPGFRMQHARARAPQIDRVDQERREEQRKLGENGADHAAV